MQNSSACRVIEGMPRAIPPGPAISDARVAARTLAIKGAGPETAARQEVAELAEDLRTINGNRAEGGADFCGNNAIDIRATGLEADMRERVQLVLLLLDGLLQLAGGALEIILVVSKRVEECGRPRHEDPDGDR